MTGRLVQVWTPADFDAVKAAMPLHEAVLPLQNRAHALDKVLAQLGIEVDRGPIRLHSTRGRRYRGQHRANRFRLTVADLKKRGVR